MVYIQCYSLDEPVWIRHGGVIKLIKHKIETIAKLLTISNFTIEDEGTYVCLGIGHGRKQFMAKAEILYGSKLEQLI